MSFLTDTDVNKRARNLFAAFEQSALSGAVVRIKSQAADMTYLATYQTDFPGTVAVGGVWDSAQTGANGVLSSADTVVTFNGTGCTEGTDSTAIGFPAGAAVEFEILNTDGIFAVGIFNTFIQFLYDSNLYLGGQVPGFGVSAYYQSDGLILNNDPPDVVPALAVGDIVGLINGGSASCFFYLNGVLIVTAFNLNVSVDGFPSASRQ